MTRMAEYIERDDALNAIERSYWAEGAYERVERLPTADVVEVKHGRWIEKVGRAKCSVCADECWADSAMEYSYCPNCGARMDGE